MLPQMNMVLETKWVNWIWIESSKSLLEFNWNLLWMFRTDSVQSAWSWTMWGLDVWCESAGRARGHILHWSLNPLSLSARLGRFRIWKDIAPEFIGGYILGKVQQLYIEEDMGGTWEVGAADLRRFHRADTYIERPSDKGLAYNGHSSSHQVKHNAIKILPP